MQKAGASLRQPRYFEQNSLLDFTPPLLEAKDAALRLRRAGHRAWLTYKGAAQGRGWVKQREEYETEFNDAQAVEQILRHLGLVERFRYEKYRAVYQMDQIEVCLDEAPIGFYLELEGPPQEIESVARRMGFRMEDAITATYPHLYELYRDHRPEAPPFMIFPGDQDSR